MLRTKDLNKRMTISIFDKKTSPLQPVGNNEQDARNTVAHLDKHEVDSYK